MLQNLYIENNNVEFFLKVWLSLAISTTFVILVLNQLPKYMRGNNPIEDSGKSELLSRRQQMKRKDKECVPECGKSKEKRRAVYLYVLGILFSQGKGIQIKAPFKKYKLEKSTNINFRIIRRPL